MDAIKLDVNPRETGKRAAKAIRRAEEVPCVLYGHHTDPVHFRVPVLDLRPLIYTAETHRVEFELGGETYDCIVKHIDYHPVSDVPIHADFLALTEGETLDLTIPVVTRGTAPGVKAGGLLSQPLNELVVRCLPKDIPGHIEIDVSALEIGDSLHVSDLTVENVEILTDLSRTVVTVTAPSLEPEPEEEEGLLLEGELAEGEELPEGEEAEEGEGEEDEA
jgi:large subunit ribosomal protein L25